MIKSKKILIFLIIKLLMNQMIKINLKKYLVMIDYQILHLILIISEVCMILIFLIIRGLKMT